jgi:CheY-like chemotaxis protein
MSKNDGMIPLNHGGTLTRKCLQDEKQILLVDDNLEELSSVYNVLIRGRYRVILSVDPHHALKIFRDQSGLFDLIITDLMMPGMRGNELVSLLRQVRPDIPVIMCSGSESALQELQAQGADIQEYMLKPFSVGELMDAVRRLVG